MKTFAGWIRLNPGKAHLLAAIMSFFLFMLAVTIGAGLQQVYLLLHEHVARACLLVLALVVLLHQVFPLTEDQQVYRNLPGKLLDVVTGIAIFLLIVCMANRDKLPGWNVYAPAKGHYVSLYDPGSTNIAGKTTMSKKELRKTCKAYLKQQKEATGKSNTGLIIALIFGGLVALFFVLILSFYFGTLAGQAAGWLIFFLGVFAIVFIITKVINSSNKKKKNRQPPPGNNNNQVLEL